MRNEEIQLIIMMMLVRMTSRFVNGLRGLKLKALLRIAFGGWMDFQIKHPPYFFELIDLSDLQNHVFEVLIYLQAAKWSSALLAFSYRNNPLICRSLNTSLIFSSWHLTPYKREVTFAGYYIETAFTVKQWHLTKSWYFCWIYLCGVKRLCSQFWFQLE